MKKESVHCDLCGKNSFSVAFKKQGFRIVRCKSCGLYFVNPRLRMDVLKDMYNDNKISPVPYYKKVLKDDRREFRRRANILERYIPKGSNVLDIGCNIGTFITELAKRGHTVQGLDLNKDSIDYAKSLGLNVQCSTFEDAKLKKNSFDVIIMNDLIEHVPSPTYALEKAHSLLKPDGVLFISTPDIGASNAKFWRTRWLHMKPDEHITYFDRKTIRKMLSKTGFDVLWNNSVGRYRSLAVIIEKGKTYFPPAWWIVKCLGLDRILGKISMHIDPGDEMGVIARKR